MRSLLQTVSSWRIPASPEKRFPIRRHAGANLTILVATILAATTAADDNVAVNLAWDPSVSTNVSGYRLHYGMQSGAYTWTNPLPGATTTTIVNGLTTGVYYFAVTAVGADGGESEFSNELAVTNAGGTEATNTTTGSTNTTTGSGPIFVVGPDLETTIEGVPPVLVLSLGDRGPTLRVLATVGADLAVEVSTNLANPLGWKTMANLTLTNPAGPVEAPAVDLLAAAFVPSLETFFPPASTSAESLVFYRVTMPYNYAVLAAKVLQGKGCQTWLIVVRLPGETLRDVCYVGTAAAYIDYSDVIYLMALKHADPSLRAIADSLGNYVNMNWTSASAFILTNGARQLTATVVKTDSPASDCPLTANMTSSIVIDF